MKTLAGYYGPTEQKPTDEERRQAALRRGLYTRSDAIKALRAGYADLMELVAAGRIQYWRVDDRDYFAAVDVDTEAGHIAEADEALRSERRRMAKSFMAKASDRFLRAGSDLAELTTNRERRTLEWRDRDGR